MNINKEQLRQLLEDAFNEGMCSYAELREEYIQQAVESFEAKAAFPPSSNYSTGGMYAASTGSSYTSSTAGDVNISVSNTVGDSAPRRMDADTIQQVASRLSQTELEPAIAQSSIDRIESPEFSSQPMVPPPDTTSWAGETYAEVHPQPIFRTNTLSSSSSPFILSSSITFNAADVRFDVNVE